MNIQIPILLAIFHHTLSDTPRVIVDSCPIASRYSALQKPIRGRVFLESHVGPPSREHLHNGDSNDTTVPELLQLRIQLHLPVPVRYFPVPSSILGIYHEEVDLDALRQLWQQLDVLLVRCPRRRFHCDVRQQRQPVLRQDISKSWPISPEKDEITQAEMRYSRWDL